MNKSSNGDQHRALTWDADHFQVGSDQQCLKNVFIYLLLSVNQLSVKNKFLITNDGQDHSDWLLQIWGQFN